MDQIKESYPDAVVEGIWPKLTDYEEVKRVFVFLVSDKASYITGEVLSVDGLARTWEKCGWIDRKPGD